MFKTTTLISVVALGMLLASGCASTDMHNDGNMMHDNGMDSGKMESMEHDTMKKDAMDKNTMKKDAM